MKKKIPLIITDYNISMYPITNRYYLILYTNEKSDDDIMYNYNTALCVCNFVTLMQTNTTGCRQLFYFYDHIW